MYPEITKFDHLNRETFNYNNGISGRRLDWYELTTNNGTTWRESEKKGHYLGNGQYVED